MGRHQFPGRRGECITRTASNQSNVGSWQRTEPQVYVGNDSESTEPAHLKFGQIVAGHVLDDPSARIDQPSVAGRNGATQHVVTHRSKTVAERAGSCSCDD